MEDQFDGTDFTVSRDFPGRCPMPGSGVVEPSSEILGFDEDFIISEN